MIYDNEDSPKLTPIHETNLNHIFKRLSNMADIINIEPYDPKIATHLRMAADLAEEQVNLGKYYTYAEVDAKEPDYKFLEQDDTVEEHNDIQKPVSEPPPSNLVDDDIHKWLDGINGD